MTEVAQTKSGGNNTLLIILGIVILILIGAVAFLLLSGAAVTNLLGGGGGYPQDQFVVSMDQLVLRPSDMDVAYQTTSDLQMSNAQFSNNTGAAYAKPFVQNTGRVTGWDLSMERVNPNDFAPEFVRSRVEYYEDAAGASDALSEEWFWAYQLEDRAPDEFVDESCNLGSDCVLYKYSEAKAGSGNIIERYDVAFRTDNVLIWTSIKGVQGEVSADQVQEYGQMVLDKVSALDN